MHKKLVAALTIALFALSSVAILTPASAHFTLGDYTSTYRFHENDFDPHVPGPLAYVWPGGGLASYSGTPWGFPPGYQTPYPGGNPEGQPSSIYQLEGNAYAPFGAILTSTEDHANRGPLIFALNFSQPCEFAELADFFPCDPNFLLEYGPFLNYTGITIYIPPEFDLSSAMSNFGLIESTFAVTASDFWLSQSSMQDPIGPGWWVLNFEANIRWWPDHQYQEWYYLRINDVVAPTVAGKYFFKIFLWDLNTYSYYFQMNVPGAWSTDSALAGGTVLVPPSGPTFLTVPVENWPVLLVKGELDPGIVTGTIRYGTFNQSLYGQPINFPGRVRLVGVANDPYTGQSTGRPVEAQGYFNASAAGHYEVEGVAPGVYDVYGSAAGYPEQLIASGITILPGQSFHLDAYLNPGAVVHGQVFSKHLFGEQPWPSEPRPISINIYNSNDYAEESIVAWSPWNKTHAPYMSYDWGKGYSLPTPLPVAYPWDTNPPFELSYYFKTFDPPETDPDGDGIDDVYAHDILDCGDVKDVCGKPDGVGPAQYWWVDEAGRFTNGGGSNSFIFQFGVKGTFGAPTDIDGHVPQTYATWVNGLTPGRYWIRVWLNGYVQTLQDGITLDESYFDISKDEWAGDIFQPLDVRVSSTIVKTVHFHDQPGTLQVCPISGCPNNAAQGDSRGNRYLIAEVRDAEGNLMGMNFTYVDEDESSATIQVNGFGMMGPDPNSAVFDGSYIDPSDPSVCDGPLTVAPFCGMKFSLYRYFVTNVGEAYHDYGLPSGTYKVYVYMRGYVQQVYESVSITLSGSPALISNHLYRGARFNITVYSIDWEHPRIQRPWSFPGARIRVYVYDQDGNSFRHVGTRKQPAVGPTGGIISGACNLNLPDEVADHCKIVEWDGYSTGAIGYTRRFYDTPPDVYTTTAAFVGFLPVDQQFWAGLDFLSNPGFYRFGAALNFKPRNAIESGTYTFYGYAYGYVHHKQYSVSVLKGGFGDIKLNLLQGVNLTLNIQFKTEGVYTPTQFNMSMRVRVFDDEGRLIGTASTKNPDVVSYDNTEELGIARNAPNGYAWTYYVDPYATSPSVANLEKSIDASRNTADTFLWYGDYYPEDFPGRSWQAFDSDVDESGAPDFSYYNNAYFSYTTWIPAKTEQVRVFIAGTYDAYGDPLNSLYAGILSGRTLDGKNDWQHVGLPGSSATIPEGVPVGYSGSYTVEVDTWNEYPTPTFDEDGFANPTNWYPPVEGLLEGDSFHTIPGHPAGPFGYVGDSLAANGLGPYAQRGVWTIPNAHLGSEISAVFELDKRGYISGNVYGFTWSDELRPQSWVTVEAVSAAGDLTFTQWSWDSHFQMYLDAGGYTLNVISWTPTGNQGYNTISSSISISTGQAASGLTFQMERSNIPIPEFSGLAIVAFSALAGSLYVLRRRRR